MKSVCDFILLLFFFFTVIFIIPLYFLSTKNTKMFRTKQYLVSILCNNTKGICKSINQLYFIYLNVYYCSLLKYQGM